MKKNNISHWKFLRKCIAFLCVVSLLACEGFQMGTLIVAKSTQSINSHGNIYAQNLSSNEIDDEDEEEEIAYYNDETEDEVDDEYNDEDELEEYEIDLYAPYWKDAKNVNKTSAKLSWDKVYDADSYEIECALNDKFTSNKTVQVVSGTSCTFTKLKAQKKYYFRVRSKRLEYVSDWSYTTNIYIFGNSNTMKITTEKNIESIREALSLAATTSKIKYEITVPKGKYVVYNSLHIYSNTTLILKGVKLVRSNTIAPIFRFGFEGKGKYSAGKNITLKGGVLDAGKASDVGGLCIFTHINKITFDGVVFKYLPKKKLTAGMRNPHMIEFAGSKNVTIKKCKFYNNKNCFFNNEAVQLESMYPSGTTPSNFGKTDGTQCKNVTIKNCYFKGFNYGCGSNHLNAKDHFTNMKFINNTFVNSNKYAICLFGYRNVLIKGNKLINSNCLVQNQNSTNVKIEK